MYIENKKGKTILLERIGASVERSNFGDEPKPQSASRADCVVPEEGLCGGLYKKSPVSHDASGRRWRIGPWKGAPRRNPERFVQHQADL